LIRTNAKGMLAFLMVGKSFGFYILD